MQMGGLALNEGLSPTLLLAVDAVLKYVFQIKSHKLSVTVA